MKYHKLVLAAASLFLVAGCDDLFQLSVQEELENQDKRLTELQQTLDGIKKSDTPFSLVVAVPPADTVSKGLDFTSTLRINPSGLAFTKDMIGLDYISGKQFYRVEPNETKASYVKSSAYFSLKNFEADKNAGEETLDGQYVVTLTTKAQEAVWDDSRMAFVGAYVDKEGKNQLVSSNPFNTVMMPLPSEGLSPWIYPHASYLIQEKKKDDKGAEIIDERFGAVYLPLDGVPFKTKDDSDGRFYTSENLKDVTFVPDEGCDAAVKIDYDLKKRYVSFEPDTTGNLTWRAFNDSTGVKRQEVKGSVIMKDRWGGVSSYHVNMYWYNTYVFPINVEATVDEIKAGIKMNLMEEVNKLGLEYEVMKDCRRVTSIPVHHLYKDLAYEPFDLQKPEEGELILYATPVPRDKYQTQELRSVTINASEVDAMFAPLTVSFKLVINLTIK